MLDFDFVKIRFHSNFGKNEIPLLIAKDGG
jgi:hypothetical protein